jgi:uncharacterized protein YcfL
MTIERKIALLDKSDVLSLLKEFGITKEQIALKEKELKDKMSDLLKQADKNQYKIQYKFYGE